MKESRNTRMLISRNTTIPCIAVSIFRYHASSGIGMYTQSEWFGGRVLQGLTVNYLSLEKVVARDREAFYSYTPRFRSQFLGHLN